MGYEIGSTCEVTIAFNQAIADTPERLSPSLSSPNELAIHVTNGMLSCLISRRILGTSCLCWGQIEHRPSQVLTAIGECTLNKRPD